MRPHPVASPPHTTARIAGLFTLTVLLATTGRATGQQPPRPADQEAINQAIERGVQYLKRAQNPTGTWGTAKGKGFGAESGWVVGYTALAGLTLVECGVPTTDPGLKRAAAGVRSVAGQLDSTYEVALAILFLDRMGDKQDRKVIQMMAARLMAGQTGSGGWGYKVPKLSNTDLEGLLGALRKLSRPQPAAVPSPRARPAGIGLCIKASDDLFVRPPPKAVDEEKARTAAVNAAPLAMRRANVLQNPAALATEEPKDKRHDPAWATTDNSNTHFAMLALWAARRHDVPVDRSFDLLVRRFRTSQNGSGMWGYDFAQGGGGTPAMTCVALLGVAIGHVTDPDAAVRPEADPKIITAFTALGRHVGNPAGTIDNRPAVKEVGGLYYLWAMERIAVLYDIRELAQKDWYLWGAEILVGHQSGDGSWSEEGGFHGQHPVINTCFALMFLKRANLTPDLARRLTVDAEALSAKVSTTSTPPKPSEPEPKASEPEPQPGPQPEPTPQPEPEPQPPTPTTPASPAEPAATSASTPPKTSSFPWVWLLLLLLLLAVLVAGYVVYKQKQQEAAKAAAARKQKRKKKPAFEVVEDDG